MIIQPYARLVKHQDEALALFRAMRSGKVTPEAGVSILKPLIEMGRDVDRQLTRERNEIMAAKTKLNYLKFNRRITPALSISGSFDVGTERAREGKRRKRRRLRTIDGKP